VQGRGEREGRREGGREKGRAYQLAASSLSETSLGGRGWTRATV